MFAEQIQNCHAPRLHMQNASALLTHFYIQLWVQNVKKIYFRQLNDFEELRKQNIDLIVI